MTGSGAVGAAGSGLPPAEPRRSARARPRRLGLRLGAPGLPLGSAVAGCLGSAVAGRLRLGLGVGSGSTSAVGSRLGLGGRIVLGDRLLVRDRLSRRRLTGLGIRCLGTVLPRPRLLRAAPIRQSPRALRAQVSDDSVVRGRRRSRCTCRRVRCSHLPSPAYSLAGDAARHPAKSWVAPHLRCHELTRSATGPGNGRGLSLRRAFVALKSSVMRWRRGRDASTLIIALSLCECAEARFTGHPVCLVERHPGLAMS